MSFDKSFKSSIDSLPFNIAIELLVPLRIEGYERNFSLICLIEMLLPVAIIASTKSIFFLNITLSANLGSNSTNLL